MVEEDSGLERMGVPTKLAEGPEERTGAINVEAESFSTEKSGVVVGRTMSAALSRHASTVE